MKPLSTRTDLGLGLHLRLPDEIEAQMRLWREELVPMPQSYIDTPSRGSRPPLKG